LYCHGAGCVLLSVVVAMEIMRTTTSRFANYLTLACCLIGTASAFAAGGSSLQNIAVLSIDHGTSTSPGDYHLAAQTTPSDLSGAALVSDNPSIGYTVSNGTTTVLIALPKIQTIDTVSFFNRGAKGRFTVATSNVKLPAASPRWKQITRQELSDEAVKAALGPNEAKYIRVTFDVNEPGQISALGVYSPSNNGTYALLAPEAGRSNEVESDGKNVADAKDMSKDKEIPAEGAESPAEGPPPGLPDPPPFTFIPVLVPTSP
jgi:hypothetical protein